MTSSLDLLPSEIICGELTYAPILLCSQHDCTWHCGDPAHVAWRFYPHGEVLVVDGITYRRPSGHTAQPMFELRIDDVTRGARMRWNCPPTDRELEDWCNGDWAY